MKKVFCLLTIMFLFGCSIERNEYYSFSIDDYKIVVGYDNREYLENVFEINNNEMKLINTHFANAEFNEDIISYFEFNIRDYGNTFKIDDLELNKSIKTNCEILNGEYFDKQTKGCIIQKQVGEKTNAIIMYGDILNDDLDELSKIEIYVK